MEEKDLGLRIKKLRESQKMTQQEFSEKIEISRSMLSQIEAGKSSPTFNTLLNIMRAFKGDANYFFDEDVDLQNVNLTNIPIEGTEPRQGNDRPKDYWEEGNFYLKHHIEKKLLLDLIDNHPEWRNLYFNLNELGMFRYVIENIFHYYFNDIELQRHSSEKFLKDNKMDYDSYKENFIEALKQWQPLESSLNNIVEAIKKFYSDFKQYDTQNVIDGATGNINK